MAHEQRLAQEIENAQQRWDLLTEKITYLEREKNLAIDPDAKFNLEHKLADIKAERAKVEQELTTLEQQQEALDRKIDLLRQENLQKDKIRQTSQRKSVGTKPYVEKLFVDRVAYLEKLTEYVCCDETHLIVIVGQGGIGKTALAAKFCDDIEKAGYAIPLQGGAGVGNNAVEVSPGSAGILPAQGADGTSALPGLPLQSRVLRGEGFIRAIVYVSKTEMAAFTLEQVFAKLAQTLAPEEAARVEPILKDPKAEAALKTEKLLDGLRGEPTLLVLDNFEAVLAEHAITHPDLETFLHTVCATQHSLKVIITSRYEVNLKSFGVVKKILLNEGLKIADAVDFLRRLGHEVTQIQQASDPELRQLAQKVHGVSMALRSLAGFLVERAQRRLTVAQLLADQTRFAAFKKHDFKEGLRKLIDEQYRMLPEAAQLALQAMAVYNAPVKPVAVQYLFPAIDAEAALDDLAYSYFLAQHNRLTDQFELHPSVQEYAYERLGSLASCRPLEDEPARCRRSEMHARAADFYAEMQKPKNAWKTLPDVQPHLDEIEQRIKAGDYDRAARVLDVIDFNYLQLWGYSRLVIALREQLIGHLTDEYLIMVNYGYLGLTYWAIGRVKEAIPLYEKALESARKEQNKQAEGAWLGNLGIAYLNLGEPTRAIEYYTQALTIDREIGDKRGEGIDLGNLGEAYLEMCVQQGAETWLRQAIESHQRALEISEEIHYPITICNDLRWLGLDYLLASDVEQAAAYFQRCIATCDQALAQSPLYEVFYYRAFALLALACLVPQASRLRIESATETVAVQAYRKAIEINAAAGVLREQIHEVERLQQILRQKRLDTPDALAATETVLELLKNR